jgi:hypothetical protein
MSLADTELSIGGVKLKGIYIAVVFSLATTIGGFIWGASSLYGRLEAVEAVQVPDVAPLHESIQLIEQQLKDNDISQLSAKLATLGTNLTTISSQQEKLLEITTSVNNLEKEIEAMKSTVKQAELISDSIGDVDERIKVIMKEIDDIWLGLDAVAMPL